MFIDLLWSIYVEFVPLLTIFLTAFDGNDNGAVPKNTIINRKTNISI